MSQTPSDEQQWQQPAWDSLSADPISDPPPADQALEPITASVLVPAKETAPSALESILTVVLSAIWPVAIIGAILGYGSWWWNIGGAIVIGSVLGAISGERPSAARPDDDPLDDTLAVQKLMADVLAQLD